MPQLQREGTLSGKYVQPADPPREASTLCAVYVAGMDKCWLIIKFILQLENVNHSHWNLARGAVLLRLVLTRTLSSTVLSTLLLSQR